MRTAWYWARAVRRGTWQSALVVLLLCAILGSVALGALAGARRTESAYGRYLRSINASDVWVNIPSPDTRLVTKISHLPGVRSGAAWLGLDANPVVHGHVDDAFLTDALSGSLNGEFFKQDVATAVKGRLPPLDSHDGIALTASVARLFGVGVGGRVKYQFENPLAPGPVVTGYRTYRVAAIVDEPPVLVDQFDQTAGALLPPGATAKLPHEVSFSWVGIRLTRGDAGIPAFQGELAHLAQRVGHGYSFAIRQLDQVHEQVQEAIRPQAVALGLFGVFALLALLVLVGQSLAQFFDRNAAEIGILRTMGLTRRQRAVVSAFAGGVAVVVGLALAVVGAVALSPLAPVGPVRQFDPARGFQFDTTVLVGGGLLLAAVLLGLLAWMAWRSSGLLDLSDATAAAGRPSAVAQGAASLGLPVSVAFGTRYALEGAPGRRVSTMRASMVGSVVAVAALVTAVVFGASLNGLVTHPTRYGWNWNVLIQAQGGYGSFLSPVVTPRTFGDGDGPLDHLMASQSGVRSWSTFGFTQLPIDGHSVPVLGLTTHRGTLEPPTTSGRPITGAGPVNFGSGHFASPDQIELGSTTLRQLGKHLGDRVLVGTGPSARRLTIVGTVTLPSIGVTLSDHVSLGRGAMLPESTLRAVQNLASIVRSDVVPEAVPSFPSTVAVDMDPGFDPGALVHRIVSADPEGTPGGTYQVHRVLGAAIVNAGQMGGQPVALAVALAAAVLISLGATLVSSARRRRRELAVLMALGFTRGQLRTTIASQTVTLLVVAVALGLPLGLAAGHWAWDGFAASIGVVPVAVVPLTALILGLVVLMGAGVALTALPAVIVLRSPTSSLRVN